MFRMDGCVRWSFSGYSYLVLLMNLVGLCQVVGVGCPTVEKEYGKLVTIHTANKAPTEPGHFVPNTMDMLTSCTWFTIKAC